MKQNNIGRIALWSFLILIFMVATVGTTLAASGFRLNWPSLTMQRTGLIMLKGDEKKATVELDGKAVGNRLPSRIMYVMPGWHEVSIGREGFHEWRASLWIESGKACEIKDIVLFRKGESVELIHDESLNSSLQELMPPSDLYAAGGEIRTDGHLITRLSQEPSFFNWYNDRSHVLFQLANTIRAVDIDGRNDTLLVELESEEPSKFKSINGGKTLIFTDGDVVKSVKIR